MSNGKHCFLKKLFCFIRKIYNCALNPHTSYLYLLYEYIHFLHACHIFNIGAEYLICFLLNLGIPLFSGDEIQ